MSEVTKNYFQDVRHDLPMLVQTFSWSDSMSEHPKNVIIVSEYGDQFCLALTKFCVMSATFCNKVFDTAAILDACAPKMVSNGSVSGKILRDLLESTCEMPESLLPQECHP